MILIIKYIYSQAPRHDRVWEESVSKLSLIDWTNESEFNIQNLRDWEYNSDSAALKDWTSDSFDINNISSVWFYKQPFGSWDGIAHTFLVFEFINNDSKQYLGVSVEARKEARESYSGFKGLFNKYELVYQWVTEKDLLTRRAVMLGDNIHQYKLDISKDDSIYIIKQLITKTQNIEKEAHFYNTLKHNCTNELAESINQGTLFPSIPKHYSFFFTGFSDKYLYDMNYISNQDSFEEILEQSNITDLIISGVNLDHQDFGKHIRK